METSSHNSEVIHAGIYYPECSLKARLCVKGKAQLYAYLEDRGIAHRRCGKVIVATDEAQKSALTGIARQRVRNGVTDLEGVVLHTDSRALSCTQRPLQDSGLLPPGSWIHGLMTHSKSDAESSRLNFSSGMKCCEGVGLAGDHRGSVGAG